MMLIFKVLSLIIIFIGFIGLGMSKIEYDTLNNGEKISVVVTYVPKVRLYSDVKYDFEFMFNGKRFKKTMNTRLCGELNQGDTIFLIYNREKNIFLCENEKPIEQAISSFLIFSLGIIGMFYPFIKKSTLN